MLFLPEVWNILWILSTDKPYAKFPFNWRIWSPNLRPAMAAGLSLTTTLTNIPLSIDCTLKPIFPCASLHKVNSRIAWLTWAQLGIRDAPTPVIGAFAWVNACCCDWIAELDDEVDDWDMYL